MSWDFKFADYGEDWAKISEACKKRDGYKCRKCGARGFKATPPGDATLHACHIVSRGKGGKNVLENLVTKCVKCHMKEDGHGHMKANKSFKKQAKNQKKKFTFKEFLSGLHWYWIISIGVFSRFNVNDALGVFVLRSIRSTFQKRTSGS